MILVGTSGWSYAEWYGPFYPSYLPKANMLLYYSRFFDTAEVNSSFYSYPSQKTVMYWYKKTPSSFHFAVKLNQKITHEKRLLNVEEELESFLKTISILGEKLGVILVQLPPSLRLDPKLLEEFLSKLPKKYKFAVEFRHKSWLKDEVFSMLEKYGVAYVCVDEPLLPPIARVTSSIAYVRFHGRGEKVWYDYKYSRRELEEWKPKIEELDASAEKVYVFFNNHFHGHAVEDALVLKELLGQETAPKDGIERFF